MITKEDYQLVRSHPAFSALPVELFDKLAVEIHARDIQKDKFYFMQEISGIAFFFFQKALLALSNSIRLINFPIWIISRRGPVPLWRDVSG